MRDNASILYTAPVRVSIVMNVVVGLSVCLSVCLDLSVCVHISETARPNFSKFSVRVACGRRSVFLWLRCDKVIFKERLSAVISDSFARERVVLQNPPAAPGQAGVSWIWECRGGGRL